MRTKSLLLILLTAAKMAIAETVQYSYDVDSRLTSATYNSGNSLEYSYDAVGNLLQFNITLMTPTRVELAAEAAVVPAFKSVAIKRTNPGAVTISFSWNVTPHVHYRLQHAESLTGPWVEEPGDISSAGTSAETVWTDSSGATQRFFRLVIAP